jgi:hypothetical protein
MLVFAMILFLCAVILGFVLLLSILKDRKTNKPLAVLHGTFGGFGLLVALTYIAIGTITPLYLAGIGILLIAITLGFIVFGIDISNMRIPKWLALLHPLFALTGIAILVVYMTKATR